MKPRIELVPVDEARRLGAEMGISEAQASRSAYRMLAHHPDLVRQVYGLLRMLQTRNKVPSRLRELIVMRIGWTTKADYEWFQHYRIATKEVGLTDAEIVAIREWKGSTLFSDADRAVLAAVDDTRKHGAISDEVWAQCERAIPDPAALVEMVVMIGNWTLFSQVIKTLRIPVEEGQTPWPPDGKAP